MPQICLHYEENKSYYSLQSMKSTQQEIKYGAMWLIITHGAGAW
jgi:hypothetical protein